MDVETQAGQILKYLREGNSLTPLEALNKFGCFRLGARIWDLKKEGHDIRAQMVEVGDGKRVAKYYLAGQLSMFEMKTAPWWESNEAVLTGQSMR